MKIITIACWTLGALLALSRAIWVRGKSAGQGLRGGIRGGQGCESPLHMLPLLLLLAALSVVFLSPYDRGFFYRSGHHDNTTSNYLSQAANMSVEHNFMGIVSQAPNTDGILPFDFYNRFPVGGRLLLMLAVLPFEDNMRAQIISARTMMLFFFVGAAVMAYLSLSRLTSHRWTALAATCLAFSSSFCLYYSDVVNPEVMPDLFGVLLTFHGMIVFVQEGRIRQLLVKTCLALLIGWHVFALLLPFVMLGLASELVRARPHRLASVLLHSRHISLGAAAFLFGLALLGFNFALEYYALDGRVGLTDLPSFQSMLRRTGFDEAARVQKAEVMAWLNIMKVQYARIATMSIPFALADHVGLIARLPQEEVGSWPADLTFWGWKGVGLGIAVTCTSLVGLVFVRHKILWMSLVLLGFCWSLPMRYNTISHDFEAVYYIGLLLFLFSQMLLFIRRWSGDRVAVVLSVAAVAVFVLSGFKMAGLGNNARLVEFNQDMLADFEAIRSITKGKVIAVPHCAHDWGTPRRPQFSGGGMTTSFYLAGSTILFSNPADCDSFDMERIALADFVISRARDERGLLTPMNRRVFLFDRAAYFTPVGRETPGRRW